MLFQKNFDWKVFFLQWGVFWNMIILIEAFWNDKMKANGIMIPEQQYPNSVSIFLIICCIKTDIKGGKCFDLSLFEHPFLTSHLKWVGRLNLFSFLWESIRHDDLLMGRQYKVCCLFEWTPSCRKESGYPIIRSVHINIRTYKSSINPNTATPFCKWGKTLFLLQSILS